MPSHHLSPALRRRARAGRRGRRQHRPAVLRRSPRPVRRPLHLGRQAPQPLPAGVQRPDRRLLRQVRQSHRGRRVALRRERRHHQRRLRPGVRQSPAEAHRGVARHRQLPVDAARPPAVSSGLSSVPFSMFRNGLPLHTGRSDHKGPSVTVAGVPRVGWTYKTGGSIFSSPTLASDGTVYVGCTGTGSCTGSSARG